jgi:hypothetical protein
VALGQILLQHRGDPAGALALFEQYLARTRAGPLAREAAYGRIQALRRLGRREAERRACRRYLARHPRSLAASLVRRRLEALRGGAAPGNGTGAARSVGEPPKSGAPSAGAPRGAAPQKDPNASSRGAH